MLKEFFFPVTRQEAQELKLRYCDRACFIAGGTEINSRDDIQPEYLISLARLQLDGINYSGDQIAIGATTTLQDLLEARQLEEYKLAGLSHAAGNLINRNVRNIATLGGNIAASRSCSDMLPILLVYRARLEVVNPDGHLEEIPLEQYLPLPEKPLITRILIARPLPGVHAAVKRYTRSANDLAIVIAAAAIELAGAKINQARIAVGGVARHAIRIQALERTLTGSSASDYQRHHIEKIVAANIAPISDIRGSADFKKHLAGVLVAATLEQCLLSGNKGGE